MCQAIAAVAATKSMTCPEEGGRRRTQQTFAGSGANASVAASTTAIGPKMEAVICKIGILILQRTVQLGPGRLYAVLTRM
mmetsp:Transcript_34604/g.64469  ORF Transcript_34604/g.64469 Transcript_34604/m.64469 type:complete len:80 (-) Transcript_34604:412-651(-)